MSTRHFNNLTPAEAERLALLAEECGEVVQAVAKVLRHGYESPHGRLGSNRADLMKEMGDVRAAMVILSEAGDVSLQRVHDHAEEKLKSVAQYLHHQPKDFL